jgi:ubiquitin carboxyl-terminal hydrolase 22/27/51
MVPAKLLYCVWNYASYLADYDQQDAHEFFIALINGWNTHIRTFHYFPSKHATSPRVRDTQLGGVTQIFSGIMQSKLTCLHCRQESSTDEDFIDISLSIELKSGRIGRLGIDVDG